jgi:hypothetical protein
MGEQRERLFRDASGAAVERAAQLEDENRALRAEVERLRLVAGEPAPPPRGRADERVLAGLLGGMLALFVGAAAMISRPHGHCPSARGVATVRLTPGVAIAPLDDRAPRPSVIPVEGPVTRTLPRSKDGAECNPPYTISPDGHRRYKLSCIE